MFAGRILLGVGLTLSPTLFPFLPGLADIALLAAALADTVPLNGVLPAPVGFYARFVPTREV